MSLLVLLGVLAAAPAEAAPASVPPRTAAPGQAPAQGVVRYDAAFFVEMRPNTAFDMIQRLPGFAFDPGQQVRGFAGAAGNVLIDGERPTSKQDDLQSILKRVVAGEVDHIDVIRGGAPGIDMHGQTVIANVVRKSGSGASGVVAVATNIYTDGRAVPAARFETTRRWDGKTLELAFDPAWYIDDSAGDGNRVRTDPNGNELVRSQLQVNAGGVQLNGTAAYETPAWGGKFKVNVLGFYDHYFDNEDDQLIVPVGSEVLVYRNKTRGELGLHFEKALSPKLNLETLAIQKIQSQEFPSRFVTDTEEDVFDESDLSGETIARAIVRYRKSDKLSAEASVEGAFNIQSSDSTFAVNGQDIPLPAAKVTVQEKRGEGAALTTWRPSSKITVEAGMRAEISQISSSGDTVLSKTLFFPKPRAVLTWSPDADDQFRFRVEREVGQLNFADFAASSALGAGSSSVHAGNPDLNPQTAWVFEAAYEKHIKGAVFVVTYRRQQISDVVDRIPITADDGTVFDGPGNIGDAVEDDILANVTLPLDLVGIKRGQLKAQGTLRHSRVTDPTTGRERTISAQHRYDYEVHFTQDLPRWNSSWGVDVFNRWTEANFRFNEVDVYKLKTFVILFYEYKPKPGLSIRGEIDNVGGRGFQRLLYVYDGPRNTSPLSYIDNRRQDFKPYFYLRVRRTFG